MFRDRCRRLALALLIAAGMGATLGGYFQFGPQWPDGPIPQHLQLGSSPVLADGCASWGCAAEAALAIWNPFLQRVQFAAVRDSTVAIDERCNSAACHNNVIFGSTFFGASFDGALAAARTWSSGGRTVQSDVVFNTLYQWDSYRGPLRSEAYDLRRVALHEFGHTLGLDHPDWHGQTVAAIMNSRVSNLDTLQDDDINGVLAMYSSGSAAIVNFPPRNETFDFRSLLESKYRDGLGRGQTATFTDVEGSVVWLQEYLRYRLNACSHLDALQKTDAQLLGNGIQPVCGLVPSGTLAFPSRNEPFDYRLHLEAIYQDVLKRGAVATYVDLEGDVVWIQEYIRYRLTGCTHSVATERVFFQIDGGAVMPGCTSPPPPPPPGPPINPMTGTWEGAGEDLGQFTMVLSQNGSTITGTYNDSVAGPGRLDPASPGTIDAAGNVTLRVKQGSFSDFTFRGTLNAAGNRVTGTIRGSGFNSQAFSMDKQ